MSGALIRCVMAEKRVGTMTCRRQQDLENKWWDSRGSEGGVIRSGALLVGRFISHLSVELNYMMIHKHYAMWGFNSV